MVSPHAAFLIAADALQRYDQAQHVVPASRVVNDRHRDTCGIMRDGSSRSCFPFKQHDNSAPKRGTVEDLGWRAREVLSEKGLNTKV